MQQKKTILLAETKPFKANCHFDQEVPLSREGKIIAPYKCEMFHPNFS